MILSAEIQKELNEIALQLNKTEEEILYKEFLKLQKEFEMWDEISDPYYYSILVKYQILRNTISYTNCSQ